MKTTKKLKVFPDAKGYGSRNEHSDKFISITEIENLPELEGEVTEVRMTEMSNEQSVRSQGDYPYFTFDGKYGTFKLNGDEIHDRIRLLMLKFRQSYFAFSMNKQEKWNLFTEEFDFYSQSVKLFKSENGVKEQVGEGTIAELKQTFATLKMKQVIYAVIFTPTRIPQIVKFSVKGTALRELFNFYKEFAYGEHIYQWIVGLGSRKDRNQSGDEYNIPTFKKVKMITEVKELRAIQNAMLDIESKIRAMAARMGKEDRIIDNIPLSSPSEEVYQGEEIEDREIKGGITEADLEQAGLGKPRGKTVEQVKADLNEKIERANNMGKTSSLKL